MEFLTQEKHELFNIYLGLAGTLSSDVEGLKEFMLYYGKPQELKHYDTLKEVVKDKPELRRFNKSNVPPDHKLIVYKSIIKILATYNCFFTGCKNDIALLEVFINGKYYIYVYSNVGTVKHHLDNKIISYAISPPQCGAALINLKIFLLDIIKYYRSPKYTKIVLCGHSNGMSASLYISYILSVITAHANPEDKDSQAFIQFIRKQKDIIKDENGKPIGIVEDINIIDSLRESELNVLYKNNVELIRNKTFVCGTGGFPIIFRTQDEFNNYYNYINTNYVHIVKGIRRVIKEKQELFIDYFTLPNYDNCFVPSFNRLCQTCKFRNFNTILFIDDEVNQMIEVRNLLESDKNNLEYNVLTDHTKPYLCTGGLQLYFKELHLFRFYRAILVPYFINIRKIYNGYLQYLELKKSISDQYTTIPAFKDRLNQYKYQKYLKYKQKYLELKKYMENR